jgi:transposase-like protein
MPAHSRLIERRCARCGRVASREVFNAENAPQGYSCWRCASQWVRELNATQRKESDDKQQR